MCQRYHDAKTTSTVDRWQARMTRAIYTRSCGCSQARLLKTGHQGAETSCRPTPGSKRCKEAGLEDRNWPKRALNLENIADIMMVVQEKYNIRPQEVARPNAVSAERLGGSLLHWHQRGTLHGHAFELTNIRIIRKVTR